MFAESTYQFQDEGITCGYLDEHVDQYGNKTMVRCEMKYKQQKGRLVHIKEYHEKRQFTCPLATCQKVFTRKWDMRKHFSRRHQDLDFHQELNRKPDDIQDTFTCDYIVSKTKNEYGHKVIKYCGEKFSNIHAKVVHQRKAHAPVKNLKCQVEGCNELFDRPFKVKIHMEKYHPDQPYTYELHYKMKKEGTLYYDGGSTQSSTPEKPRVRSVFDKPIQEICKVVINQSNEMKLVCNKELQSTFSKKEHLKEMHNMRKMRLKKQKT